ncbi:MAG: hypothetical protein ABH856_03595 [Patescibacteria group bacterium]|nr:hypothetical protein [Patescibacteria group bacterium]
MKSKPGFFKVLLESFRVYESKWKSFFAVTFLAVGTGTYLQLLITKKLNFYQLKEYIADPGILSDIEIPIHAGFKASVTSGSVSSLIPILLGIIMIAAIIHLIQVKKTKFQDAIAFGFKNLWRMIKTALYVLWYTLSWLVLVLIGGLVVYIINIFATFAAEEKLKINTSPEELRETVERVIATSAEGYTLTIIGIFAVAILITFIIATIRSVRATFSYYALFEGAKVKTIQAVKNSVKAVKGNWWLVLWYGIAISILVSIVMVVVDEAVARLLANFEYKDATEHLLSLVLTAVFLPIVIVFQYVLYRELKK